MSALLVATSEPLVPCTTCSCSGIYVDYAGPNAQGYGYAVPCKTCDGKGWVTRDKLAPLAPVTMGRARRRAK